MAFQIVASNNHHIDNFTGYFATIEDFYRASGEELLPNRLKRNHRIDFSRIISGYLFTYLKLFNMY